MCSSPQTLSNANLSQTKALGTNFNEAIFTGACLEDWNINSTTSLNDITCDYVYLKKNRQERCPISGNFAPGQFTHQFQKKPETINLIFTGKIDWKAVLVAFQKLHKSNGNKLSIQDIQNRDDQTFIRVNVPPDVNKSELENNFKQQYKLLALNIERREQIERQGDDKYLEFYQEQNQDLIEIINKFASNPVKLEAKLGHQYVDKSSKIKTGDITDSPIIFAGRDASGVAGHKPTGIAGRDLTGQVIINNNDAQKKNLAEAAAEIQQILDQLCQTHPTTTGKENMIIVAETVDKIESNPTLKTRVINALKLGGVEAFKEAIDHPLVNVLMAAIEGWREVENEV